MMNNLLKMELRCGWDVVASTPLMPCTVAHQNWRPAQGVNHIKPFSHVKSRAITNKDTSKCESLLPHAGDIPIDLNRQMEVFTKLELKAENLYIQHADHDDKSYTLLHSSHVGTRI